MLSLSEIDVIVCYIARPIVAHHVVYLHSLITRTHVLLCTHAAIHRLLHSALNASALMWV